MLDPNLQLSQDPRHPKRHKDGHKPKEATVDQAGKGNQQMNTMMQLMAKLLLRHEHEIQQLHKTDTFMLFCNKEPTGILQGLLQETRNWKQQLEKQSLPRTSLRQHLFQSLLQDLLNRVTRISKCQQWDKLYRALLQKNILLEDYSWPFLQWDGQKRVLTRTAKTPVSMVKMMEHIGELIEMARDPTLVIQFHAMNPRTENPIVPWRLQLSLRHNAPWELLLHLAHSSMWTLLGTSLKGHNQTSSSLAKQLQQMLTPSKPKGSGKGGKSKSSPSTPS